MSGSPSSASPTSIPLTESSESGQSADFNARLPNPQPQRPSAERLLRVALDQAIHLRDWLRTANRLRTFLGWPYDAHRKTICTSQKLAEAGFVMTSASQMTARCVVCELELCWSHRDNAHLAHLAYRPDCLLTRLPQPDSEYTVQDLRRLLLNRLHFKSFPTTPPAQLYEIWADIAHDRAMVPFMQIYMGIVPGPVEVWEGAEAESYHTNDSILTSEVFGMSDEER